MGRTEEGQFELVEVSVAAVVPLCPERIGSGTAGQGAPQPPWETATLQAPRTKGARPMTRDERLSRGHTSSHLSAPGPCAELLVFYFRLSRFGLPSMTNSSQQVSTTHLPLGPARLTERSPIPAMSLSWRRPRRKTQTPETERKTQFLLKPKNTSQNKGARPKSTATQQRV